MIKWLLLSAFLVNLLAFYWFSSQPARKVENKPGWEESFAEIVLLSELKVIPPERSPLVAGTVLTEDLEVVANTSIGVDMGEYAVRESLGSEVRPLLQNDESGLKAGADEKGSLSTAASDIELRMESEIMASRLESEEELPCVLLGRFDSEQDAVGLLEKLERTAGVSAKLQMVTEGLERYLVYMPPFETKIKAKQQQSALKENGIRSALYYKGALKNGLSLGFFASKNNASRRYDSLLAAGYEVELKTVVTEMSRFWLEFGRHELAKLSQFFWQDLAREFPNVLSKPAECAISGDPEREERAE